MVRLSEEEKLSQRKIAERLGISKTTVNEVLKRRRSEGEPSRVASGSTTAGSAAGAAGPR